jgi:hypothetical protein
MHFLSHALPPLNPHSTLKTASNGTATTKGARRSMLQQQDDAPAFVRGSYTGFRRAALEAADSTTIQLSRRALKQEVGSGKPEDYECKIVSLGFTNRVVQPLNNRTVLAYD